MNYQHRPITDPRWQAIPRVGEIITTPDRFNAMMQVLDAAPVVVFDFETSGLKWWAEAFPIGIALGALLPGDQIATYYVPFAHGTGEPQMEITTIWQPLKRLLADGSKIKVAHNLKFDWHFARRMGWDVTAPYYDTMGAAHLYNENERLALKTRATTDLQRPDLVQADKFLDVHLKDLAAEDKLGIQAYLAKYGYRFVTIELLGLYACADAYMTMALYLLYERRFSISTRYERIWRMEMDLTAVLVDMEAHGQKVDLDYLGKLEQRITARIEQVQDHVFKQLPSSHHFNLNSDQALRNFMQRSGLRWSVETATGALSVDGNVLETLSKQMPLLTSILEYRELRKLLTTYTHSLASMADKNTVLHPSFQQYGTNSGRLSCREPNFQNIPNDIPDRTGGPAYSVRSAFIVPEKNWVRVFRDYSQIELRVMAFYSRDPLLLDSYAKNEDVHTRTAQEVFGSGEDAYRKKAKIINFGLSYGLSPAGFARQTGVSMEEAESYYQKFFEKYQGINNFKYALYDRVIQQNGYFENVFGRPRRVPEILSGNRQLQTRGQRQAIGSLIQGTASELTKLSIVRIHHAMKREGILGFVDGTIHDEISVACDKRDLRAVDDLMKKEMESYKDLEPVPILSEGEYTETNWTETKKVGE